MKRLGIFVDRRTMSSARQIASLLKCRDIAESRNYEVDFIFPVDIDKIPKVDALFIRARTDPMNITYVASRIAELNGIPVIDDSRSIQICADKINMYSHLDKNKVSIPKTVFLSKKDITVENAESLFRDYGTPLIIKEPSTSFSARVEMVKNVDEFFNISKRFIKLSDWVVVQQYIESVYDWRVGVLGGKLLYVCKYIIPSVTFKIQASIDGHIVYCDVEGVSKEKVPPKIIKIGIDAANAIGNGLYGVDIKNTNGSTYVIEVNDNPSLESGEDQYYPRVYEQIVDHLFEEI
jgi:glutathione synthase/RimK-type ligase-like ATP-grasp enzyme